MDKRSKYKPVAGFTKNASKKPLTQGTLTGCEDKLLSSKTVNKENLIKGSFVSQKNTKQQSFTNAPKQLNTDSFSFAEKNLEISSKHLHVPSKNESSSADIGMFSLNVLQHKNTKVDMATTGLYKNGNQLQNELNNADEALHTSCTTNPLKSSEIKSKKKKLTKSVASRYMAQADKVPHTKEKKPQPSSEVLIASKVKPPKLNLNVTEQKQKKNSQAIEKTSTPTNKCKTMFESDMSVIHIGPTATATGPDKHTSINQNALNSYYAQYLRICYLKSTLKKSSQAKANTSMCDLQNITDAIVNLEEEVAALESEVNHLEHEKTLNEQVVEHLELLEPVETKLDEVCCNYKKMAQNVDTMRHGLPIVDAVLSSENSLLSSLTQIDSVLNDIAMLTHSHTSSCSTAAHHADCLESVTANEIRYLKSAHRNLKLATALLEEDSNLKLQLETENLFLNN